MFRRPAEDERGLPAVSEFFGGLIEARCSGEYARWGCMVAFGVDVRSRAGADATTLRKTVTAALDSIADGAAA